MNALSLSQSHSDTANFTGQANVKHIGDQLSKAVKTKTERLQISQRKGQFLLLVTAAVFILFSFSPVLRLRQIKEHVVDKFV
jgi:hypothetical protein